MSARCGVRAKATLRALIDVVNGAAIQFVQPDLAALGGSGERLAVSLGKERLCLVPRANRSEAIVEGSDKAKLPANGVRLRLRKGCAVAVGAHGAPPSAVAVAGVVQNLNAALRGEGGAGAVRCAQLQAVLPRVQEPGDVVAKVEAASVLVRPRVVDAHVGLAEDGLLERLPHRAGAKVGLARRVVLRHHVQERRLHALVNVGVVGLGEERVGRLLVGGASGGQVLVVGVEKRLGVVELELALVVGRARRGECRERRLLERDVAGVLGLGRLVLVRHPAAGRAPPRGGDPLAVIGQHALAAGSCVVVVGEVDQFEEEVVGEVGRLVDAVSRSQRHLGLRGLGEVAVQLVEVRLNGVHQRDHRAGRRHRAPWLHLGVGRGVEEDSRAELLTPGGGVEALARVAPDKGGDCHRHVADNAVRREGPSFNGSEGQANSVEKAAFRRA